MKRALIVLGVFALCGSLAVPAAAGEQGWGSALTGVGGVDDGGAGLLEAGHQCLQQIGSDERLIALHKDDRPGLGRECGQPHLHRGAQPFLPAPVHHCLHGPRGQRCAGGPGLAAEHDDDWGDFSIQGHVGDVGQEWHTAPIEKLFGLAEAGGCTRGQDDGGDSFHDECTAS